MNPQILKCWKNSVYGNCFFGSPWLLTRWSEAEHVGPATLRGLRPVHCTCRDSGPGANRGKSRVDPKRKGLTYRLTYRQTGSPERPFRCFDPNVCVMCEFVIFTKLNCLRVRFVCRSDQILKHSSLMIKTIERLCYAKLCPYNPGKRSSLWGWTGFIYLWSGSVIGDNCRIVAGSSASGRSSSHNTIPSYPRIPHYHTKE